MGRSIRFELSPVGYANTGRDDEKEEKEEEKGQLGTFTCDTFVDRCRFPVRAQR